MHGKLNNAPPEDQRGWQQITNRQKFLTFSSWVEGLKSRSQAVKCQQPLTIRFSPPVL